MVAFGVESFEIEFGHDFLICEMSIYFVSSDGGVYGEFVEGRFVVHDIVGVECCDFGFEILCFGKILLCGIDEVVLVEYAHLDGQRGGAEFAVGVDVVRRLLALDVLLAR